MRCFMFSLLLTLIPNFTFADPIRLVGRGIADRKTGAAVAFQCIAKNAQGETSCNQIQLIALDQEGSTRAIGKIYTLHDDPKTEVDEAELKIFLKGFSKAFKKYKRDLHRTRRAIIYGFGGTGAAIGILASQGGKTIAEGAPNPLTIAFGVWGAAMILASKTPLLYKEARFVTTQFDNKKGWNWSINPKKENHHNFETLIDFGTHGYIPNEEELQRIQDLNEVLEKIQK